MERSRITPQKHREQYAKKRKFDFKPYTPAPEMTDVRRDVLRLLTEFPDGLWTWQLQEKLPYYAARRVATAARYLLEDGYITRERAGNPYKVKK